MSKIVARPDANAASELMTSPWWVKKSWSLARSRMLLLLSQATYVQAEQVIAKTSESPLTAQAERPGVICLLSVTDSICITSYWVSLFGVVVDHRSVLFEFPLGDPVIFEGKHKEFAVNMPVFEELEFAGETL